MKTTLLEDGAVKALMGYRDGTHCCRTCKYFVPTDCSGNLNAKDAHCTLSPAFDVLVNESGYCNYHNPVK